MKIELRNIKYAAFASQETNCYEAALYVDGNRIGFVSNEGYGGPDNFHGDEAAYKAADAWCKANLPKWDMSEFGGGSRHLEKHDTDLEMYCGTLLAEWLSLRDMRRAMKKKILFQKVGEPGIYEIAFKQPRGTHTLAGLAEIVLSRNPGATILNTMSEADALAIWSAAAI